MNRISEPARTRVVAEMEPDLSRLAANALDLARQFGADEAEVSLSRSRGASVSARMGETETIEYNRDSNLVVSVYFRHHLGSASSGDLSEGSMEDTVRAACSIARYTGADECLGLADKELMASDFPDLHLDHEWDIEIPDMVELAIGSEASAMALDDRIVNSEGASVSTHRDVDLYANSHGFVGGSNGTRHSLSVSVIAAEGSEMQRGYWYTSDRDPGKLQDADEVGLIAAKRTIARLGARQVATAQVPVLYDSTVSSSLVSHFLSAISGGVLYKKASFLVDQLGESVFAEHVNITERPHLECGAGSAAYDSEGVTTPASRSFIESGSLKGYVLGSYTARKLGMQTTANSGGVRNVLVEPGNYGFEDLVSQMGTGFLVTELIGSGINMVTGDYSRGAVGFWVENGEIRFPVEGVTIAGNLRDMYKDIAEIGMDVDTRGNIHCGSILLNKLTVAGT